MVGAGTPEDPRRPKYAPVLLSADRSGVLAWNAVPSDDGSKAIVEFVAADRTALHDILTDKSITAFERGKYSRAEIEPELKKWRKDIDVDRFLPVAQ